MGLDLLRITASLTIIAFHGSLQAAFYNRGPLRHGYLAVDIFFVLSGFLLTRQALKMRSTGDALLRFASRFWTRRWFRILPAYWVVLAFITLLVAILPIRGTLTPKDFIRHALFLQTLLQPNQYAVTWSLVTEEWFYLALPFVLFLFTLLPRRDLRIIAIVAIMLTPTVVRLFTHSGVRPPTQPQQRFDGLVVGAALGAVWSLAPDWKAAIHANRKWLFVVGSAGLFFTFVVMTKVPDSRAYWTVGILVTNICVGMTIPSLTVLRWPAFLPVWMAALVTFLSDLTYPLYLVHDVCYSVVDITGIHQKAAYFGVALPLILATAIVLHVTVERPFLAWRSRLDSNTRRRPDQLATGIGDDKPVGRIPSTEPARVLEPNAPSPLAPGAIREAQHPPQPRPAGGVAVIGDTPTSRQPDSNRPPAGRYPGWQPVEASTAIDRIGPRPPHPNNKVSQVHAELTGGLPEQPALGHTNSAHGQKPAQEHGGE